MLFKDKLCKTGLLCLQSITCSYFRIKTNHEKAKSGRMPFPLFMESVLTVPLFYKS